jgi:hypothetical protein
VQEGFIFVFSIVEFLSMCIAFFAGLFSIGTRRIALVLFALVMAAMYVLLAFSNFGA